MTRDLVERAKPDPHLFLAAARRLGVEPAHCSWWATASGTCSPHSGPVPWASGCSGWLRPRGTRAVRRLPRLRRPGRDADPAGGGRRPAYPLTVAATAVVASQVEHVSITVVCGRVLLGNGSAQRAAALELWLMPRTCAATPSW